MTFEEEVRLIENINVLTNQVGRIVDILHKMNDRIDELENELEILSDPTNLYSHVPVKFKDKDV